MTVVQINKTFRLFTGFFKAVHENKTKIDQDNNLLKFIHTAEPKQKRPRENDHPPKTRVVNQYFIRRMTGDLVRVCATSFRSITQAADTIPRDKLILAKNVKSGKAGDSQFTKNLWHVQKRMGALLRDLKNRKCGQKLSDGKPLTGKGRLTDMAMKKLQIFYGLAIRRNTNSLEAMQAAVWTVYFHIKSSNKKPTHQLCFKGNNTW
ncbi:uncharacterized protein LOC120356632, partial [Nilaparvata lugens]|uniref:uncharacterized protein LOC120356632 n=1 Tax=Nilaparvata lugens TaxID=108931 RepID=UPI00193D782D